jgi:hypothetical protein
MSLDFIANVFTILGFIVAVIATFYIPRKIMVNQIYEDLVDRYNSVEMGEAIYSVFWFYKHDCECSVNKIYEEYIKRFNKEIKDKSNTEIEFSKTLHFQRRMLEQYYWHLATLRYKHKFIGLSQKKLTREFLTSSEVNLLALIYYMTPAAKAVFEKTGEIRPPSENVDGMVEELIYRLYEEAKEFV